MGRETLSTSPGFVVSVLAGGPNRASGTVPGHIGTCVWPGDGCQPGFWANRLLDANTTKRARIKGLITIPTVEGYTRTNSRLRTGTDRPRRSQQPTPIQTSQKTTCSTPRRPDIRSPHATVRTSCSRPRHNRLSNPETASPGHQRIPHDKTNPIPPLPSAAFATTHTHPNITKDNLFHTTPPGYPRAVRQNEANSASPSRSPHSPADSPSQNRTPRPPPPAQTPPIRPVSFGPRRALPPGALFCK